MERIVVAAILLLFSNLSAEGCILWYTKRPVLEIPCIPSDQMKLACAVGYATDVGFKLRWTQVRADRKENIVNSRVTDMNGEKNISLTIASSMIGNLSKISCEVISEDSNRSISSTTLNIGNVSSLRQCQPAMQLKLKFVNTSANCILTESTTLPEELPQYVLFAVAALVVLFAILIVILSLSVVLLCRRKCGNKPSQRCSRRDCENPDADSTHSGFSNRLSSEKKNLSVTFSASIDSSGKVSSNPLLLPGHTHSHKTCPSMPCPPTPEQTKLDIAMPTSHFLDVCQVTREGGRDESCEGGSEQDDEGAGKTTPTSVPWADPLRSGVRNPTYNPSSPNLMGELRDSAGLEFADSAYVRSRYEWSEPDSMTESSSTEGGQYSGGSRDKYRGDYERDPLYQSRQQRQAPSYVNQPHANNIASFNQPPPRPPRTDKYRGDYERSDTYEFPPTASVSEAPPTVAMPVNIDGTLIVPPPAQGESNGCLLAGIGSGKYRGNYERSNLYVQNLLKTEIPSSKGSHTHTEHVQLLPSNSM